MGTEIIEIFKHGLSVETKLSKIEGIITGTIIRFNAVAYEISYFREGEYKHEWLNENEFNVKEPDKIQIGFRRLS